MDSHYSDQEASVESPLLSKGDNSSYTRPMPKRSLSRPVQVLSFALAAAVSLLLFCAWGSTRTPKSDSKQWPTDIGYAGPTPTGSEAFAAATSYPHNTDSYPLTSPNALGAKFLYKLGNLSPWRTVSHGLAAGPEIPAGCELEQIHLLHRHGARYPTSGAGPASFAKKLAAAKGWKATGSLEFLNDWTYKLGAEVLTPFGREQLFNLGAGFRVKYGGLLNYHDGKKHNKLVFRTESQDRMLKSALNFAAGFWGIPYENQYHQLITVEAPGYNNTLAPYMTCPNANRADLNLGRSKVPEWISIYLKDALERLQADIEGFTLTLGDLWNIQQTAAYEVVALGGSSFSVLFTEDEWEGFEYAMDLAFWYGYSFGNPAQAAVGLGWVQEWLARVTQTPLTTFNSSTNATYHSPQYFPLDQPIYVDATHDTVISAIITTLNFSSFAASGPLPSTHIPRDRAFDTAKIAPFAANLQAQVMRCGDRGEGERTVRWLLNDGVVPLEHIEGCEGGTEGECALDVFVRKTIEFTSGIDWAYDCLSPYELGSSPIVDGRPQGRP